jgi:hypothetical protein
MLVLPTRRKADVPRTTGRQKVFRRQYDSSFDLGNGQFLDVDVEEWSTFVPRRSEAWKLQKDIVIKWLDPNSPQSFDSLRWAVPDHLRGSQSAMAQWMLDQFNSRLVRNRIPDPIEREDS